MQVPIGSEYYSGKTLLVTGATGFVGKVLIEAILRNLPDVRRVYVLLRSRADNSGGRPSVTETLREEILGSSAFNFLRARYGRDFDGFVEGRLEAVNGDLSLERLGLQNAVYEKLCSEVDVVINSAALAVFDAPLDDALQANALGPLRVLEFARGAVKRPFVAHISTCYVSNVAGPIFETPLAPHWTPIGPDPDDPFDVDEELQKLIARVEWIRNREPDRRLRTLRGRRTSGKVRRKRGAAVGNGERSIREEWIEQQMVEEGLRWARRRGWNDTYTFLKAMGEQLFARHQGNVPGLILRPAIIESSLRTPSPGWIEGFRMLDPLIVGFARGQLFEFPGNPEAVLDVVPVDTVVNALLMAIPWTHSGQGSRVYQVASGMENPLLLKRFRDYMAEYFEKSPLRRIDVRGSKDLPVLTFPEMRCFLRRLDFQYLLPLRLLEAIYAPLRVTKRGRRKQASLGSRRTRIEWLRNTAAIYGPYSESQSRFLTYNLRRMWKALPPLEQRRFPFTLNELEWKHYVQEVHLPGIERYLLRMPRRINGPAEVIEEEPCSRVASLAAEYPASVEQGESDEESDGTFAKNPMKDGGSSRWQRAERFLSLSREADPVKARAWMTPPYKKAIQRSSFLLIKLIAHKRLELECVGGEDLPERGPFIVVANHTSHIDTGVLLVALGSHAATTHPTAAADYWFRSRIIAWLLHSTLGGIPFNRRARNVPRALAMPAQVLRNGHSLIFYPEGSRSSNGEMKPFKSTIGLLALASGAPIVPAYITGASRALAKGEFFIKHFPVRVHFSPAIAIESYLGRLDRQSVSAVSRHVAQDAQSAVDRLRTVAHEAERIEAARVAQAIKSGT
ncbi:MAG: SDR family oxidoreductase [Opitutales bacterium]